MLYRVVAFAFAPAFVGVAALVAYVLPRLRARWLAAERVTAVRPAVGSFCREGVAAHPPGG